MMVSRGKRLAWVQLTVIRGRAQREGSVKAHIVLLIVECYTSWVVDHVHAWSLSLGVVECHMVGTIVVGKHNMCRREGSHLGIILSD